MSKFKEIIQESLRTAEIYAGVVTKSRAVERQFACSRLKSVVLLKPMATILTALIVKEQCDAHTC